MKNTKSNITRRITECRDVFKTTLEGRFRLFLCPVTLVMIYFFMCWNLAASETPQRPECYGLLMIDAIDSKAAFLAGSLKRGEFGKEEGDSIETIAKSNFASDLDMLSKWLDLEN